MRKAEVTRRTRETELAVSLNLDSAAPPAVEAGIGFFNHLLCAFGLHSGLAVTVRAAGDLQVDQHHTIEDAGIALGQALAEALGDKHGIRRFGFASVPMDEALAQVSIDVSGRPFLEVHGELPTGRVGEFEADLAVEFLRAFALNAGVTLHIELPVWRNKHHALEAVFKALGRAVGEAVKVGEGGVPSTKGLL